MKLYNQRYEEVWNTAQRKNKRSEKSERKRRARRRFSNFELCFDSYNKLNDYAQQRNITHNFGRVQYTSTLKKAGGCGMKRAADNSALAYPFEVKRTAPPKPTVDSPHELAVDKKESNASVED